MHGIVEADLPFLVEGKQRLVKGNQGDISKYDSAMEDVILEEQE